MKAEQHLQKARFCIASLDKLDASRDALAIIDGTLIAGYHLGNALLHAHGVCKPAEHFNTPSKLDAPVSTLPAAIQPGFEAFEALELLRTRHVRNAGALDASTVREARRLLDSMARECGIGV
jgi:hypothetical protein